MNDSKIIKRSKSCCGECPLDGHVRKVWGRSDVDKPQMVFLGEAPGRKEDLEGEPFVGPEGQWLRNATKRAGILWHTVHKTNVICCRPPNNNIESIEAEEAIAACKPGMWEELQLLHKKGVKVVVPLGNTALHALGFKEQVSKARGSVYPMVWENGALVRTEGQQYDMLVMPTYHPSYIMRGQMKEEPTWINDLKKAYELANTKYVPPKERFVTHPTIEEVEQFVAEALASSKQIGVDIEATSLVPEKAEVVMIGFATSKENALCVPFFRKGKRPYWKTATEIKRARAACRELLGKAPTVFQNCLYDMRVLYYNDMPVENLAHDILLLHHALSPELPHSLGYIVSEYGDTPYWKDIVLKSEKLIFAQDDTEFRTYNLRDSVVLLQCLPKLVKDCKKYGSYEAYEKISLQLVQPVMELMNTGLRLSGSRLVKFRREITKKVESTEQEMRELLQLPAAFNLNAGEHLQRLLYGAMPTNHAKRQAELATYYEPETRKSRNTKKFKELESRVELIEKIQPLPLPRMNIGRTASGALATDKEQMSKIAVACNNRIEAIKELKKQTAEKQVELESLLKVKKFLALFRDFQEADKILSTYTSFPTADDGRVHFPYKIHGTYTGRLASGNKKGGQAGNAQNIPKAARMLFIAEEGHKLIQIDYANLELYILALVSEDDVLLEAFDKYFNHGGDKPHAANCKMLFGIDKDAPEWDTYYNLTKRYIFGRNYGGSLRGIYQKLMQELPEMPITFAQFTAIDDKYRAQHPKYKEWYDKTVEQVKRQRWLRNPFGRIRYFLGTEQEIVREGLNFPIQSTASDLMNLSLIGIKEALDQKRKRSKLWRDVKFCATVHDSVIFEAPNKLVGDVTKLALDIMEAPVKIGEVTASFKADPEVGSDWKNLQAFEA